MILVRQYEPDAEAQLALLELILQGDNNINPDAEQDQMIPATPVHGGARRGEGRKGGSRE